MPKLDKLFQFAVEKNTSDIYLAVWAKASLRINWEICYFPELSQSPDWIITHQEAEEWFFDLMTNEQKEDFEKNHDIDFAYTARWIARFRVNLYKHKNGLAWAFRPISENVKTIDELWLPPALKKVTEYNNGLVLITWSVGSGKSSTLAAIIEDINRSQKKHIITIEDPIEFVYQNKNSIIEQREVGEHTLSFKNALRAALRENADIILLGEMRDLETIALAISAAETGSLVLATLHTSGTAKTVNRLIDVFTADQQGQVRSQISESLKAVVWQQLIKRKDENNRIAACEVLFKNPAVANLIRRDNINQINSIIETGLDKGMQTMSMHLDMLVQSGKIDAEEANRIRPKDRELS